MPGIDALLNALTALIVTIDPIGLAPLFLGVTRGMDGPQRRVVGVRAAVIAFAVLTLFALAGRSVLGVLGITVPAFRVAGGLLLFAIAFEMVFAKRSERKERSAEVAVTKDMMHDLAAFPLAIPLIAGPGAISATIILSGAFADAAGRTALVGIIFVCLAAVLAVFLVAERVDRFLGETGRSILTRLLGVILAALAVQYVADGVRALAGA
ncbi:MAG: MarC family protein [Phyllobacteriaceae bacterium]|nr:MarC family protein [Phyllobacteriaceae bacterium]